MANSFVIKGDIAFSKNLKEIETLHDGYLVSIEGKVKGVYRDLPEEYKNLEFKDYSNMLVIPGMTDLHVHAPQYTFRGIGMDLELLDWLNQHTFPEETHYADIEYAKKAYSYFSKDLKRSFTTRAVIFATIHNEATVELMDQLEETGVISYVGRVNMDRNSGDSLLTEKTEDSVKGTIKWLDTVSGRYERTMPILTPRFIPSCSDELMT
ncbi:MAG: amidohydrolase family protein, partial [Lachnospiraceae bacterium]|nr:amidohydrolase family protein [Lachnospiraceae bacterium]